MKVFQAKRECPSCKQAVKISDLEAREIVCDMSHIRLFRCDNCNEIHAEADALSFTKINKQKV